MTKKPVRLAVIGGGRGQAFNSTLRYIQDRVVLTAICDLNEERLADWKKHMPDILCYTSYTKMLESPDIDAVFIATPINLHFEQSLAALSAGKHVLSEVYSANTLDELERLIRAVEDSGLVYMLAENYVYTRQNMMVLNMCQKGAFGEITYAEGAYIHDCRPLRHDAEGKMTWRGEMLQQDGMKNTYPTHSLGPVAKWMGITESDHFNRSSTFITQNRSIQEYIKNRYGANHPGLAPDYWKYGDCVLTVIECDSGAVIVLRLDCDSIRPHNMANHTLQGTKGAYVSERRDDEEALVWIKGVSGETAWGTADRWDVLYKHSYAYEHPRWLEYMDIAAKAGHGGGDFFILKDFVDAILEGTRPFIDVYDAAAWSSIVPVSKESVAKSGAPIQIPRYIRPKGR